MSAPGASPTTVHLPERPSGPVLAAVVREVRRAALRGDVVLDARDAGAWPPGVALVIEHLVHRAHGRVLVAGGPGTTPVSRPASSEPPLQH